MLQKCVAQKAVEGGFRFLTGFTRFLERVERNMWSGQLQIYDMAHLAAQGGLAD